MAKVKGIIKIVSESAGLVIGKDKTFCHGMLNGYPTLVSAQASNNRLIVVNIMMCATYLGQAIDPQLMSGCSLPPGCQVYASGHKVGVAVVVQPREADNDAADAVVLALSSVLNKLKMNGYTGCDEMGSVYNISLYRLNDTYCFYSADNASFVEARMKTIREEAAARPEKIPLGILGALLGVAIGTGVILLFGLLGRYSFWSIFALSFLVVALYRKFAGKFTPVSAAITGVIGGIGVFAAPRLNAAISFYPVLRDAFEGYYEVNFWDCFWHLRELFFLADAKMEFFIQIVLMSVLGLVCLAVLIGKEVQTYHSSNKVYKIA